MNAVEGEFRSLAALQDPLLPVGCWALELELADWSSDELELDLFATRRMLAGAVHLEQRVVCHERHFSRIHFYRLS